MGQQLDFMNQPIEQLREIIQDYDVFCRTAEKLEWINIKEQYKIYQLNYTVMDFGVYEFPKSYIILSHIMDVYAQTVLSCMAYYEGWDSEFCNISREERKYCLTVDSRYKLYATLKPATLIRRDWNYLLNEINYFANETKTPASDLKQYFDHFENANVIELGYNDCTILYWAIKDNTLLAVDCGYYD